MKNTEKKIMIDFKKKEYIPPKIECVLVNMEEGIASGSAVVKPTNKDSEISEGWETDDQTGGIIWE
ncbi:TPA: hypothetical protein I9Y78_003370 [Elizabethkingia anophelis]|nr:hypothetical protein [Elizabethkingia anophelis]HAT3997862.1 hypothetical protein [Elizabethkingia anophelis]HAT4005463.1 hypothetical protein [Elizabethkingia anophelis]